VKALLVPTACHCQNKKIEKLQVTKIFYELRAQYSHSPIVKAFQGTFFVELVVDDDCICRIGRVAMDRNGCTSFPWKSSIGDEIISIIMSRSFYKYKMTLFNYAKAQFYFCFWIIPTVAFDYFLKC